VNVSQVGLGIARRETKVQADRYASGQGDPRGVQVGNEPAETVVENVCVHCIPSSPNVFVAAEGD
jgi:hypothetical protein